MPPISSNSGTTGRLQALGTSNSKRASLDIRPFDLVGNRVPNIVELRVVAVRGEEEDVFAVGCAHERGGLDERAVEPVTVEDLLRGAGERNAVFGYRLQHQRRRGEGLDSVSTAAAMPDRVPVDFVDDVSFSVVVLERRGINSPALGNIAEHRRVKRIIWPLWVIRRRGTHAMSPLTPHIGAIVQDVFPGVVPDDAGGPDGGILVVHPFAGRGERVVVFHDVPFGEVLRGGDLHVEVVRVGREGVPGLPFVVEARVGEVFANCEVDAGGGCGCVFGGGVVLRGDCEHR